MCDVCRYAWIYRVRACRLPLVFAITSHTPHKARTVRGTGVHTYSTRASCREHTRAQDTVYGTGRLSNQKNQNILHTLCMRSGFWLVRLYYPLGSPARVPTRATCHVPPGLTSTNSNTHDTAYNTHTNDGTPACGMEQIIGTGKA